MSRNQPSEAFPQADYTASNGKTSAKTTTTNTQPRRRRRSSGIPGDPIGDTETPAIATMEGFVLKSLGTDAHLPAVSIVNQPATTNILTSLRSAVRVVTNEERQKHSSDDMLASLYVTPGSIL